MAPYHSRARKLREKGIIPMLAVVGFVPFFTWIDCSAAADNNLAWWRNVLMQTAE